jgi:ribulose-5-phosphate 4-epimerase/fuculose-1-phosphate aldolase
VYRKERSLGFALRLFAPGPFFFRYIPFKLHAKQTASNFFEEEGQQVAGLLGDDEVVLLLGHGAVTASTRSVEGSVMTMAHLEHQARLNYLALCALGPDHPSILLDLANAVETRAVPPHIAARQAQFGGERGGGGLWAYLEEVVGSDM